MPLVVLTQALSPPSQPPALWIQIEHADSVQPHNRSAQSQTLQSQPDAVYWTFVAIVALTPLLLFLIAVTAKCMLRRERQDMGVGDAEIVSILCKAHTADVRVRLAITYFTLCCAWAIYTVTDLSAYIKWLLDMSSTRSQAVFDEQWSLPAPLLGVIDGIIPRLILLALRPVDREGMCAVGAYSVVQGLICLASDYNMFKHRYIPEAEAAEWSPRATAIVCFMAGTFPRWSFFTLANLSVCFLHRTSTRGALRRLWRVDLYTQLAGQLVWYPQAALYLLAGDAVPFFLQQCCWGSLIGTCVVVPVYLYRGRIQRGAMSMVLPSDANGLVAVAALMRSGLSPRAFEQRTLEAVRMLRMLPWSALREEHFESAQSSEEERLYFRATSRPATFGEVDAFISHSWSDRGPLRFRALQSWAREFEEHNGREPHIWFDKACIDQDDIQRSLLGLPIFVSGCSSFVVLAGPTYVSRLWCILELFCFMTTRGSVEDVHVLRLEDEESVCGQTEKDERGEAVDLSRFQVSNAACSKRWDREQILASIEAAFGDHRPFNKAVRSVFCADAPSSPRLRSKCMDCNSCHSPRRASSLSRGDSPSPVSSACTESHSDRL